MNRVKIISSHGDDWLSAPIIRTKNTEPLIKNTIFRENLPWRRKALRKLEVIYVKHPFFKEVYSLIEGLFDSPEDNLANFNINAITAILEWLQLNNCKLIRSSTLNIESASTQRLIDIVNSLGASEYLCGGGAAGYQEDSKFSECGLALKYQNFVHPSYQQYGRNDFTAGLSIIDCLMNLGACGTRALLLSER